MNTKKMFFGLVIIGSLLISPSVGFGDDAASIMDKVFNRDDGTSEVSYQKLSTCRYAIKNKKLVCAEKPRIKELIGVRKDFGLKGKDKKSVAIISKPQGEKGIGFLQYDYDDPDHDTDQWLYLPAFGKVKRIVSGNDDEPKKGSFFGSEFGYEDMEQRHLEDYTYKILKQENYRNKKTWVMEIIPKPHKAKKSNYSQTFPGSIESHRHLQI